MSSLLFRICSKWIFPVRKNGNFVCRFLEQVEHFLDQEGTVDCTRGFFRNPRLLTALANENVRDLIKSSHAGAFDPTVLVLSVHLLKVDLDLQEGQVLDLLQ